MKYEECKICGTTLEYPDYGSPSWDGEKAPYDFPVCYECIDKIYKTGVKRAEEAPADDLADAVGLLEQHCVNYCPGGNNINNRRAFLCATRNLIDKHRKGV